MVFCVKTKDEVAATWMMLLGGRYLVDTAAPIGYATVRNDTRAALTTSLWRTFFFSAPEPPDTSLKLQSFTTAMITEVICKVTLADLNTSAPSQIQPGTQRHRCCAMTRRYGSHVFI